MSGASAIRVLIVEDSQVVAEFLTEMLNSDPGIRVVGVARDGDEALEAAQRTRPDVITMDIQMPKIDGYEATRRIMETCPTPIVIVSASAQPGVVSNNFHALEAGAVAVVGKPNGIGHPSHSATAMELLSTVKLMSEVKVIRRWPRLRKVSSPRASTGGVRRGKAAGAKAVLVGASTGGPIVLQTLLAGLPKNFPLPVLMVQHMTPGFTQGFVEWLSNSSRFPVRTAVDGELLQSGKAYVAPDGFHLGIASDLRAILSSDPPEHGMRPSVSFLFRSALAALKGNVLGVILTGMGQDGVTELKHLKDAGAITIAQDAESSVVHGMPGHAIKAGAATYVLSPDNIPKTLISLVGPYEN